MHVSGWDGGCQFEWDHAKYWPALVAMCEERREKMVKRWKELGAKVGISEWEMKTGWSESAPDESSIPVAEKSIEEQPIEVVALAAVAQATS